MLTVSDDYSDTAVPILMEHAVSLPLRKTQAAELLVDKAVPSCGRSREDFPGAWEGFFLINLKCLMS